MFSNTAFEAMYQYIGLGLHARFIEIITSANIFLAVILLIFGVMFFITATRFFSRYMPGSLVKRRSVPLSAFIRIIACLFLGMMLLRVGTLTSVKNYEGESWDANPYVASKVPNIDPEYRVSFVFDLLSRTAEETAALVGRVVDSLFESTHSNLKVPNFFFKSLMYGASSTIDDQGLKDKVDFYTLECFDKVIPLLPESLLHKIFHQFYEFNSVVDAKLQDIQIVLDDGTKTDCSAIKSEIRQDLRAYAEAKSDDFDQTFEDLHMRPFMNGEMWKNLQTSSLLVNHYLDQREGYFGIHKGSEVPGGAASAFQFLNRLTSVDGVFSILRQKELHGSAMAAERAQQFSENLSRAPHIAGFIKMLLIAAFPWLIFAVVAGYWRVLAYWFLIYLSLALWTPLWTLMYHIMNNITLSVDVMEQFGELATGVSLYGAKLIESRIYYLFAVYSWIQVIIGPVFTFMLVYIARPLLSDTQSEAAPEFVGSAQDGASKAGGIVSAGSKIVGGL